MPVEVVMPRLGWTMEEGTLVEWIKRDGDAVQVGDALCAIESDKAVVEVEAMDAGILRIPPDSPPPQKTVQVGTLLAYLLQPDESMPATRRETDAAPAVAAPQPASSPVRMTSARRRDTPTISPRARRIAEELGVEWRTLAGSGRTGRIVERDVREWANRKSEI